MNQYFDYFTDSPADGDEEEQSDPMMTVYAPDDNRDNKEGELRLPKESKKLENRIILRQMYLKQLDDFNLGAHYGTFIL